jgi:hypothetical protein
VVAKAGLTVYLIFSLGANIMNHTYLDNAISCEKNASGRGMYGHSWCDSPWKLITSSIDAMHINKADVDFIIWTGYVKIK